ncbi:hypothetical protein SAMN05216257_1073 [Meinhardsimonia xiamenensis]|jgi:hypothetical protein|uniref:Uncharacterized protein n=1 Tax=Meinhardsimonia xiamenensis TaxID=990712 RepID=A0A1G9GBF3_9RHOB|nr:hypothetical protein [Meinhardsimonia xiamenensis]PRX31983.1 hypothetical protein LV81_02650 [Meinhardsimonia xiamenensis]SDK97881.1 hypothetical protein SAMN05216257_1073 [Meinhardsimonia xiamenensis]
MRLRWLVPVLASPALALAGQGKICVTNGTAGHLLFAAEIAPAPRRLAWLAPGETLCAGPGTAARGIVSVYASERALEGCSRVTAAGHTRILRTFAEFDNCRWSDQG